MTFNNIECYECKYENNCPVYWNKDNAACLTIRKEKEVDKE